MATPAIVRVEGAAQLRAGLRRTGDDLEDSRATHLAIAKVVAGAADPPEGPSGRTARSVRPGATKRAAIVRAGRASIPYVPRDHWGDPPSGSIRPNPWLAKAAQDTEPVWYSLYEQYVERSLDKIKGA